ncbi:hypothetical protein JTE90_003692 [Oedothorax gibbosus]|uniref:FERM domain-containing protein n=1 Tax=Oedothorax gibbosus TaxID=931172 RepID=A0AAV6VU84_9ARAC|nr:hypothetical protein JTE90_003692 [Oedothorax gibbosus]
MRRRRRVTCAQMSEGRQSQVVLLDDRRLDILVTPKLYAGELLDMAASHFSLKEKEYFGLAYADDTGHYSWLQLDRRVLEHDFPKKSTTLVLYFRIKYFVESITHLRDSSTVEAFYLQTQSLVYNGIIEVGSDKAFQLAALVLQATHGDYTSDTLAKQQLKKLSVLPTSSLVDHPSLPVCEERVLEQYISLQGLSRGASIVNYMRIAESLPTYGFHYYEVKDKSGIPWWLGISYRGICQYDLTDRKVPRKLFLWKQLENLYFRDRKFSIEVYDPKRVSASRKTLSSPGGSNLSVHVWFSSSPTLTKCIWSMAISQHQFYLDRKHTKGGSQSSFRNLTDIADELSHGSYSTETSSLGRSVSSLSLPTLKLDSDSCDETLDTVEMFEALKARKEALEKVLHKKYEELKKICVREGELTGALPPEMPLSPGEQIPVVRRVAGAPLKDKLLWKKKTKDEEELAHLELQYEIQTKIVSAALKLLNDGTLKKNIRRQRKLSHQKAVQKLKEIEQKLMNLRKKEYLTKDEAYHFNNDPLIQQSANLNDFSISFSPTKNEKEDAKNTFNKMTSSTSSPILLPSHVRASSVPSSPASIPRHRSCLSTEPPTQGYTPSSVYQTQTTYRSQQYPTFSMRSPTSPEGQMLYRNKYESTLDLDGSNIYSVPTQRTSQAFDTQDDILAVAPAPPQDLGLVSRHNSLDRNRRHNSSKHRRYVERPGSSQSYDNPSIYQQSPDQQTTPRVNAYPFHHPHQYHHHRIKSPTRQQHTNMYQQNLMHYGTNTMFVGDCKTFPSAHKQMTTAKQALNPFQKQSSISPQSTLQRKDRQSPSNFQTQQKTDRQSITNSLTTGDRQSYRAHSPISPSNFQKLTDRQSPHSSSLATSVTNRQLTDRQTNSSALSRTSVTPTSMDGRWLDIRSRGSYTSSGPVSPSSGEEQNWRVQTSLSVDSFKPHVDVVEYGEFKPYWEETKPYETSDFYKYSTKHRKQQHQVASQNLHAKLLAWKANQTSNQQHTMSPVLERSQTASPATTQKEDNAPAPSEAKPSESQGQSTTSDATHSDILEWYKEKKTTLV